MATATPETIDTRRRTAVGVARALEDDSPTPSPTLFTEEFSLRDRVALVTGSNQGLGLECAFALAEAGARAVYCVDIADTPSAEWGKVRDYASRMHGKAGLGRMEYVHCDVSDREKMLQIGKTIGDKEGRLDICFAVAGIVGEPIFGLDIPDAALQKVLDVNVKGSLYTAQAAGQQMLRFGTPGSIVLISSIAAHVAQPELNVLSYSVSKSGLLQMGRTLAGELARHGIRVNTISPGYFNTKAVAAFAEKKDAMVGVNTMGRLAEPGELRGTVVWLASDASSFCTGSDIEVSGGHTMW